MHELWSQEECSSFSETPLHGEGDPTDACGDVVRKKYITQVRIQEHVVGRDIEVPS